MRNRAPWFIITVNRVKNLTGGAGTGNELPLDVFADLHKKNPRIFGTKTAGFLHKNGKRAGSFHVPAGARQIFKTS